MLKGRDEVQYEVEINGRIRHVLVTRVGDGFAVAVDGRTWQVDAARIDAQTLSLVRREVWSNGDTPEMPDPQTPPSVRAPGRMMLAGSYEVTIVPDPGTEQLAVWVGSTRMAVTLNGRRRRRDAGRHAGSGPQRIVAPMPGKIVRVLVQLGEAVRAGQPLVVVEAMKMENELRAGRDGTVAEIRVKAGALVEASTLLIVIT